MDLEEKILKSLYENKSLTLSELDDSLRNCLKDINKENRMKKIKESLSSLSEVKVDSNNKYYIDITIEEAFFQGIKDRLHGWIKEQAKISIKTLLFWLLSLFSLIGLMLINQNIIFFPFIIFYISFLFKYKGGIVKFLAAQLFLLYLPLKNFVFERIYGNMQVYEGTHSNLYFDIFAFFLSFFLLYIFFYRKNIYHIGNILLLCFSTISTLLCVLASITFYSVLIHLDKSKKILKLISEPLVSLIGVFILCGYCTYEYFNKIKNLDINNLSSYQPVIFNINYHYITIASIMLAFFLLFIFKKKYFIYKIYKALYKLLSFGDWMQSIFYTNRVKNINKKINIKANRRLLLLKKIQKIKIFSKIKTFKFTENVQYLDNIEENKKNYYLLSFCLTISFSMLIGLIQMKDIYKYIYYPYYAVKNNNICSTIPKDTLIIKLKDGDYYMKSNNDKNDFKYDKITDCKKKAESV